MGKPIILVDMDEVLTDFVTAAAHVHGVSRATLEERRVPGEWDIAIPLGITSPAEFWKPIDAMGERFWAELIELSSGAKLLDYIDKLKLEYYVVSTPSHNPSSWSGKKKWFIKYYGKFFNKIVLTQHKHLLAKENTILIDDRELNCTKFETHGGRSLLYPNQGNRRHYLINDKFEFVKDQLNNYL